MAQILATSEAGGGMHQLSLWALMLGILEVSGV